MARRHVAYAVRVMLVALAYYGCAKGGLALTFANGSVTAIWAPSGLALAVLVVWGYRMWPGVALGALLANVTTAAPAASALGITAGNTLEALAGAYLLSLVGFRASLERMRDVVALVGLAAVVSTLLGATVGVFSLWATGALPDAGITNAWRTWWLGDMGGDLLVASALLVLASRPQIQARLAWIGEALGLTAALTVVGLLVFPHHSPLAYTIFPLLFWTALRFRQLGAVIAGLIVAGFAVWFTAHGQGPFAVGSPDADLLRAQTFVGVAAITALLVAAVRSEREWAVDAEGKLAEAQRLAHIGSWELSTSTNEVSWSDELYRIYGLVRGQFDATFEGYLKLVHPQDAERVAATIQRAAEDREPFVLEERIVRPDGTVRLLRSQGHAIADENGAVVRMVGACQDITELRHAEEAAHGAQERYRALVDTATDGIVTADIGGRITYFNAGAERMFGYSAGDILGEALTVLMPERFRDAHRKGLERFVDTGEARLIGRTVELFGVRSDGTEFPLELSLASGEAAGERFVTGILRDISERNRVERYRKTEHQVANIAAEAPTVEAAMPDILSAIGANMGWEFGAFWTIEDSADRLRCDTTWHSEAAAIAGFDQASRQITFGRGIGLPGRVWASGAPVVVEDVVADPNFARAPAAESAGLHGALGLPLTAGQDVTGVIEFFSSQITAPDRELTEMMGTISSQVGRFIEHKGAEQRAFQLAAIVDGSDDAIIGKTLDGTITSWNRGAEAIYGYSSDEAIGQPISMLVRPTDRDEIAEIMVRLQRGEAIEQYETIRVCKDGTHIDVSLTISPIHGAGSRIVGASVVARDVSERKRFEGQLQHLADHDPVTGLFNRRRFMQELDRQVAYNARYGGHGAVLMIDLDRFKYVNDTLGHLVGDRVIASIGSALRARLRETDVIARLGGDEFAVLLPRTTAEQASQVAENLLHHIREEVVAMNEGRATRLTASIGVSVFAQEAELAGEATLVNADIAMYQAKENGRDRVQLMVETAESRTSMRARMTWTDRVRHALDHDRFTLNQQPILDLRSQEISQHELLLRMVGEHGDLIPPAAFLHVAEEFGMIQAIDRWVVQQAVALIAHRERTGDPMTFAVNLSGASITDAGVLDVVEHTLASSSIDPARLVLEVTETAAITNIDKAQHFAGRLADLGCGFALDDFGAGFGSFYYLKHLPFDYLKIDGDFICKLPNSKTDQLTVQAIVQIAHGLGKKTIAEFVQNEATLDLLQRYGVDYAQGYHIGKPAPVAEAWPALTPHAA